MSPAPSPERRRALLAYFVVCRDLLRLQAWDLRVSEERAPDENSILTIMPDPMRWSGLVRVGSFFEEEPSEQRSAVAHELVHLVQADLGWYFLDNDSWSKPLAPDHAEMLAHKVKHELERHADWTARALAPLLPDVPEWP